MIKKLLFLAAVLVLQSCASSKKSGDDWVGDTSKNLIKVWGPPVRLFNDGKNGEILIYGDQIYSSSNMEAGSRIAGPNYWNYQFVYVNQEGKIYSVRKEKQNYPPQAITSQKLDGTNLLTVK